MASRPADSWVFLANDIAQEEIRIAAFFAGGEMLNEVLRGEDIHVNTAAIIYEKDSPAAVQKTERQHAKTVNFALIYDCSTARLGELCPWLRACRDHQDRAVPGCPACSGRLSGVYSKLRGRWDGLVIWQEGARKFARANGYAITLAGRRYWIRDLYAGGRTDQARADRIAVNHPVQGTGADIIKIAMRLAYNVSRAVGLQGSMRIQVHDDLVIACPKKEVPQWVSITERAVTSAAQQIGLNVPLPVEHKVGPTWGSLHPLVPK